MSKELNHGGGLPPFHLEKEDEVTEEDSSGEEEAAGRSLSPRCSDDSIVDTLLVARPPPSSDLSLAAKLCSEFTELSHTPREPPPPLDEGAIGNALSPRTADAKAVTSNSRESARTDKTRPQRTIEWTTKDSKSAHSAAQPKISARNTAGMLFLPSCSGTKELLAGDGTESASRTAPTAALPRRRRSTTDSPHRSFFEDEAPESGGSTGECTDDGSDPPVSVSRSPGGSGLHRSFGSPYAPFGAGATIPTNTSASTSAQPLGRLSSSAKSCSSIRFSSPQSRRRLSSDEVDRLLQRIKELEEENERLRADSEAKSRFVSNVTHEIRTPLVGVFGMLELVLDTPLSAEQRRNLKTIESCAKGLLYILNGILDYSKIEAKKLEVEQSPFDLHDLLEHLAELHGGVCFAKGVEFVLDVAPDVPRMVVGSPMLLRQALTNLITNAIKFTSEGYVALSVDLAQLVSARTVANPSSETRIVLTFNCEDTGIGLDQETSEQLFLPFQQGDASTTRLFGGTGLGLTITKGISEALGGRTTVTSQLGKGSTFTFVAQFRLPPRRRRRSVITRQQTLEHKRSGGRTKISPSSLSTDALDCLDIERKKGGSDSVDMDQPLAQLLVVGCIPRVIAAFSRMISEKAYALVSLATVEDLFARLHLMENNAHAFDSTSPRSPSDPMVSVPSQGDLRSRSSSSASADSLSRDGLSSIASTVTPSVACILLPVALLNRFKELAKRDGNDVCLSDHKLYVLADLQLARSLHVKEMSFVTDVLLLPVRKADLLAACRRARSRLPSFSEAGTSTQYQSRTAQTDLPKLPAYARLLVAEDNKVNQLIIKSHLKKMGCTRFDIANNGAEAVKMCTTKEYDLILMDCMMPVMDGFEASKRIRASHKNIRICALTANSDKATQERCKLSGMDDCLTKPFQTDEACRIFLKLLSNRRYTGARSNEHQQPSQQEQHDESSSSQPSYDQDSSGTPSPTKPSAMHSSSPPLLPASKSEFSSLTSTVTHGSAPVMLTMSRSTVQVTSPPLFSGSPLSPTASSQDRSEDPQASVEMPQKNSQSQSKKMKKALEKKRRKLVSQEIKKLTEQAKKDACGRNPLHLATDRGQLDVMNALLRNFNCNSRDDLNWTPLHIATHAGHLAAMKLLLDAGADPSTETTDLTLALHYFVSHKYTDLALSSHVFERLSPEDIDINHRTRSGESPLHYACRHRDTEQNVVRLIRRGADVNAPDKWGNTPLLVAVMQARVKNVQVLIDAKADTSIACRAGTCFELAKNDPTMLAILSKATPESANATDTLNSYLSTTLSGSNRSNGSATTPPLSSSESDASFSQSPVASPSSSLSSLSTSTRDSPSRRRTSEKRGLSKRLERRRQRTLSKG